MRIWIRAASSILAITGGALFFVLPSAFLNGTATINYPPPQWRCLPGSLCPLIHYRPPPAGMVLFSVFLGVIGILLGLLLRRPGWRPTSGVALGLAFSLGSMALLFGIVTLNILEIFIITPVGFLVFPELSIAAMAGATVLFSYDLSRRGREAKEAITS